MTLNFSKTNLVRSKQNFVSFIKGVEKFNALSENLAFFAFILEKKGIELNWKWSGRIDSDFIIYFCTNYDKINEDLEDVREWQILRDLLSGDSIGSYIDLAEKYSLTYPSSTFRDCMLVVSGLFFTYNGEWTYCKPSCVKEDDTRVSPLFLGISVRNTLLLQKEGIISIYDLVNKLIRDNIVDLRSYLVSIRVSDDMGISAILDYIERGIYDPEYYREACYCDSYRLLYIMGKYIKDYKDIEIVEDTNHPLSFIFYSPDKLNKRRVCVSKSSYKRVLIFVNTYNNNNTSIYESLIECLIS